MGKRLQKAAYTALVMGALGLGAVAGRYSALDREYRVERKDDGVLLRSTSLNTTYPLTRVSDNVYLGNSLHNLKGVQDMATREGQQALQPTVEALTQRTDELQGKIDKRRLVDQVEEIADRIEDGWRNFKHNLLE